MALQKRKKKANQKEPSLLTSFSSAIFQVFWAHPDQRQGGEEGSGVTVQFLLDCYCTNMTQCYMKTPSADFSLGRVYAFIYEYDPPSTRLCQGWCSPLANVTAPSQCPLSFWPLAIHPTPYCEDLPSLAVNFLGKDSFSNNTRVTVILCDTYIHF